MILDIEHSTPISRTRVTETFPLGGCSGGPVLRSITHSGIERIDLVGIISEGVDTFGAVYFIGLESVKSDGSFGQPDPTSA